MLGLLLFLQSAAPAARLDLRTAVTPDCPAGEEIVVCGRRESDPRYRLPPANPDYDAPVDPQLRFRLPGGAALTPHGGTGRLGDARAMVTITVPF